MTTFAPALARPWSMPRPMPCVEPAFALYSAYGDQEPGTKQDVAEIGMPVMSAVFPVSDISSFC